MGRRQRIGYILTLLGLAVLLGAFLISPLFAVTGNSGRRMPLWIGVAISVLPLAVLAPRAIKRDLKAYQSLALLAPLYFFGAGVIWLWRSPWLGALLAAAAIALETGTILHNYQKRPKKRGKAKPNTAK